MALAMVGGKKLAYMEPTGKSASLESLDSTRKSFYSLYKEYSHITCSKKFSVFSLI